MTQRTDMPTLTLRPMSESRATRLDDRTDALWAALEGQRPSGIHRGNGKPGGFMAICPVPGHRNGDRTPSLSCWRDHNGTVHVKCQSQPHDSDDVIAALPGQFSWRDRHPAKMRARATSTRHAPALSANGAARPAANRAISGDVEYEVKDSDGRTAALHVRTPEKRIFWMDPTTRQAGLPAGLGTTALPLYGSERVASFDAAQPVYVCEGEKAADACLAAGLQAVATTTGASTIPDPDALGLLEGFTIILLPDNDEPGRVHMTKLGRALDGIATAVRIYEHEDNADQGWDAADLFYPGASAHQLHVLAMRPPAELENVRETIEAVSARVVPFTIAAESPGVLHAAPRQETKTRTSIRDRLVGLAEASGAELFPDAMGRYYADAPVADHREVIDLVSARAAHWLIDLMDLTEGKVPDRDSVKEALNVLQARARRYGTRPVHTRVGPLPDGDGFALDLGDGDWQAVVVRPGTWDIESHPVMFVRGKKSAAIPTPSREGDLGLLQGVLNVSNDRTFRLIVGFLLGALNPKGVYSGLMLTGAAGAAKTTAARLIRRVIDPTERMAEVAAMPKKQDAFGTTARGSWIPAFDNLSSLTAEQSDWLAQLATGYSTSERTLYTNAEEFVVNVTRPFIINGIDTADRGDLLSRVSTVELPVIDSYSTFDSLYASFDAVWPEILGGLLDVAAAAVAEEPNQPTHGWRVRSADHVRWVTAGESALGWEPRSYETIVYEEGQRSQAAALEAFPWFARLVSLLQANGDRWTGSMGELLDALKAEATPLEGSLDGFGWPKSGKGMSDALKRASPGLVTAGIRYAEVDRSHRTGRRYEFRLDRVAGDDGDAPTPSVPGPAASADIPCPSSGREYESDCPQRPQAQPPRPLPRSPNESAAAIAAELDAQMGESA